MTRIPDILNSMQPVSLHEMDDVQFMNRTDTKYVFAAYKLPALLELASRDYKVLEVDGIRGLPYRTTYLDTIDFKLFYKHMRGQLERQKVRYRVYESSGLSFLEVKRKTNKKRTVKSRIRNRMGEAGYEKQALNFLSKYFPEESQEFRPVLENSFHRITLVGKHTTERITLDYQLAFSDMQGNNRELPFMAIAELKRDGFSSQSPFIHILKQLQINLPGFSKYCIGSRLLFNHARSNILKPKLLLLDKIEREANGYLQQVS